MRWGKSGGRRRWTAIAAVVGSILAGCGGDAAERRPAPERPEGNVVQAGAPGEPSRRLSAEEIAAQAAAVPRHTRADVDFMQAMIHHHGQAILMTKWVRRRSASRDIPLLAKRMELSQESEIELMEKWLRTRGVEPRDADDHRGHDHGTGKGLPPGMLTVDQLGRLYTAKGRRFDRLFLRFMLHHHRGALEMVAALRQANGGTEPELDAFTRDVEADQGIEIARMRELLRVL